MPGGLCPAPFTLVPGDVSGAGTLDLATHSETNITRWRRIINPGAQVCRGLHITTSVPILRVLLSQHSMLFEY